MQSKLNAPRILQVRGVRRLLLHGLLLPLSAVPNPLHQCLFRPAQVHKVAAYCLTRLQEQNIHMTMFPLYLRRPAYAPAQPPTTGDQQRTAFLELICNGMVSVVCARATRPLSVSGMVVPPFFVTPQYITPWSCPLQAVPYEMSLASVKKYIWRKSDDLVFHFRVLDPQRPQPLPVFSPA